MKKTTVMILSLAALTALAGCQREASFQDTGEQGGVQEVTTQFVLNVAAAPQTKMSAEAVQQAGNFRGLDNGVILAYRTGMHKLSTDPIPFVLKTKAADWADDEDGAKVKRYDLGLLLGDGTLYNDGSDDPATPAVDERYNATNQSKRVLQLSIPVETDAIMVYGKAARGNSAKDEDYGGSLVIQKEDLENGNTGSVISDVPGNTVFKAKKILSNSDIVTSYDQTAALMIAIINNILSRSSIAYTDPIWGPLDVITWAEVGHQYEYNKLGNKSRYPMPSVTTQTGLEEILGRCYYDFTYIKPSDSYEFDEYGQPTTTENPHSVRPNGEYRAGSSHAVQAMIIDMYRVITSAASAIPTNAREAQIKSLAGVILDRAEIFFDKDNNGIYKELNTIRALAESNNIITQSEWNNKYSHAKDLNEYPYGDFGIPEGAAQLGFYYQNQVVATTDVQLNNIPRSAYSAIPEDSDHVKIKNDLFYYYHPNKPLVNPSMTEFEPRKYLYPAELWYYVNSPIRTTSKENLLVSDYPNGVNPWNADASWTAGSWDFPGKVVSSTRGVAVKNNINYGVALLKSAVICAATGDLEDNRSVMTNGAEDNRTFTWEDAKISLRGILIGGVNPRMNWQFLRRYETSANAEGIGDLSLFDGVIYDHSLPSSTIVQTTSKDNAYWNYTLVYDNYNSSKAAGNQNDVYVSLEFVNDGPAFWGRDNLISNGSVFYLVGKLAAPTTAVTWPTDHQIPPLYGVDGEATGDNHKPGDSKQIARVFIQDFVTEAVFKIGTKSLQNAYYSVPDLRAAQMSLGLSVDLKWEPGLTYSVDL